MTKNNIYFFIGTEAELIKIFPVIKAFIKRGHNVKIVASGQNEISKSRVLKETNGGKIDLIINQDHITKNPLGLVKWLIKTWKLTKKVLKEEFSKIDKEKTMMIVHGDTVSTVMGAKIAKSFGVKVSHIEAGLRSFDYLNPFPEEIDRVLTSKFADLHFVPSKEALPNLSKAKGKVVFTEANTIIDSYLYSKKMPLMEKTVEKLKGKNYFVFIMHRQEHLLNESFVKKMINLASKTATKDLKCLFILHEPTIPVLEKHGLISKLKENKNIILSPRLDYFDFSKVLEKATFVITDGGSNQQEVYYAGVPCLLIRKCTEQPEGINRNIILTENKDERIDYFFKNYKKLVKKPFTTKTSPTEIIVKEIENALA